jgi:hypothetical protein
VGVFGSLNSSPVPADARDYAFFVPDVFAVEAFAHPAFLIAFQEFNLMMTRRSARNVDTSIPIKEALRFGTSVVRNGLTARTVAIVLQQLISERITPHRKIRRRTIQGVLGLDLFMSLLDRTKPDFATFFTNHVAASMHRYWAAHFTGDWGDNNPMGNDWILKYKDEIANAMDMLDLMLGRILSFVEREKDYGLVVAGSMGQAKLTADQGIETKGFTTITNLAKFMDFIGLDRSDWREANAMAPAISLEINPERGQSVGEALSRLEVMGTKTVEDNHPIAPLTYHLCDGKSLHLYFRFEGQEPIGEVRLGNRVVPLVEAGFGFFVHEDNVGCSAYHVPEGMMMVYDPTRKAAHADTRTQISTLDIAPGLLRHFGVTPPSYMHQAPSLSI